MQARHRDADKYSTLANGVVGDADSARITSFVRSGWLRMARVVKCRAEHGTVLMSVLMAP
jgi:hypothetical protein